MPRPRQPFRPSTEWLICQAQVRRAFKRVFKEQCTEDFFETYGPLVFAAVGPSTRRRAPKPEKEGNKIVMRYGGWGFRTADNDRMLCELLHRDPVRTAAILHAVAKLWEHKRGSDVMVAVDWISGRKRMMGDKQWPWLSVQTASEIVRETGRKSISEQTVKDALKLIRRQHS